MAYSEVKKPRRIDRIAAIAGACALGAILAIAVFMNVGC